jgi:hypothetical protein
VFYPQVFPDPTDALSPEKVLLAEAGAMQLLIQGDRGYLDQATDRDLAAALADELVTFAAFEYAEAPGIIAALRANDVPLGRFVREHVLSSPPSTRWEWLAPDWRLVRRHLGPSGVADWRRRLAAWQSAASRSDDMSPAA